MLTRHPLGQTGLQVSPIGLGTVKFGRNTNVKYPHSFELPTDQQIDALLGEAQALQINVLDTAPAYGNSEQRLGARLQRREDWVIVSKAGEFYEQQQSRFDFSSTAIVDSVKQSLKHLQTDWIDVLLIHSNGEDVEIIEQHEVFETLAQLKQQGLIRAFGMSTKTVAGGLLTLAHADVVMATLNPTYLAELPVIQAAATNNKGVLIKKALASGHLDKIDANDPLAAVYQTITQHPGIHSTIVGTRNPQHLQQNVVAYLKALSNSMSGREDQ